MTSDAERQRALMAAVEGHMRAGNLHAVNRALALADDIDAMLGVMTVAHVVKHRLSAYAACRQRAKAAIRAATPDEDPEIVLQGL